MAGQLRDDEGLELAMAGSPDIRLMVSFRDHPKRLKLARRLGPAGVVALVDLWLWASANKPSGDLSPMTAEDVEIAAQWSGAGGHLVAALLEVNLLETLEHGFRLHDWPDWQGWVVGSEDRAVRARRAALAKHGYSPAEIETICPAPDSSAPRMRAAASGMPGAESSTAPSPSPLPTPNPSGTTSADRPASPDAPPPSTALVPRPAAAVAVSPWPATLREVREHLDQVHAPAEFDDPVYWLRIVQWLGGPNTKVAILDELAKYLAWQESQPKSGKHRVLKRGFRNWLATAQRFEERDAQRQTQARRR